MTRYAPILTIPFWTYTAKNRLADGLRSLPGGDNPRLERKRLVEANLRPGSTQEGEPRC